MVRSHRLPVALCVAAGALLGQLPLAAQAPRQLALQLPGMEDAVVRRDLVYRTLPEAPQNREYGADLRFDVWSPPGAAPAGGRPALLFVHGGLVSGSVRDEPLPKEWPSYQQWGRLAAAAGWAGVTFNHRMSTRDNADEAVEDVAALVAEVRGRAAEFGIDPERLAVAIYSAGGPIASHFLGPRLPYVRALVLFYPYLDLEHLRHESPFRPAYPAAHVDALLAFSPRHRLAESGPDSVPVLLLRAGRDSIPRLNASVDRFVAAALERNLPLEVMNHPAGDHGFDTRNHDARTREMLRRVVDFVGARFAQP